MNIIDKLKAPFAKEEPKYGKVIALTAIGVVAVEAAAFLGIYIAKKIHDAKIEKQIYDEDFEMSVESGEVSVEFETEDAVEE